MRILVTGGAGFIASHVIDKLVEEGHQVSAVDNLSLGKPENVNPNSKFYLLDIGSSSLANVFNLERPEIVIHHAARVDVNQSLLNPVTDAMTNIIGSINLFKNAARTGAKKIIYASSAAVYGNPIYLGIDEKHPTNPISGYGISKLTAEHYLKLMAELFDIKYTIMRYANIYGPRQRIDGEGGVISNFINCLLSSTPPIIYGTGKQTRDFVFVKDVVRANIMALNTGDNETINISTAKEISIIGLYDTIHTIMPEAREPLYESNRNGDILCSYLDNTRARNILNWSPVYSLTEGLFETVEHYSRMLKPESTR